MIGKVVLSLTCLMVSAAQSQTISICGGSKGQSYFLLGPLNRDASGWHEDGITNGKIELVKDRDQFDIFYADAVGSRSMRADGFTVISVPQPSPEFTTVLAINPSTGIVEHYLFQLDPKGNGIVLWGSIKGAGAPIAKSSLYKSDCKGP